MTADGDGSDEESPFPKGKRGGRRRREKGEDTEAVAGSASPYRDGSKRDRGDSTKPGRRAYSSEEGPVTGMFNGGLKLPGIGRPGVRQTESLPDVTNPLGAKDGQVDALKKKLRKLEKVINDERKSRAADAGVLEAKIKLVERERDEMEQKYMEAEEKLASKTKQAKQLGAKVSAAEEAAEQNKREQNKKLHEMKKNLKAKVEGNKESLDKLKGEHKVSVATGKKLREWLLRVAKALKVTVEDEQLDTWLAEDTDGHPDKTWAPNPIVPMIEKASETLDSNSETKHKIEVADAAYKKLSEEHAEVQAKLQTVTRERNHDRKSSTKNEKRAETLLAHVREVYAVLGQTYVEPEAEAEDTAPAVPGPSKGTPGKSAKPTPASKAQGKSQRKVAAVHRSRDEEGAAVALANPVAGFKERLQEMKTTVESLTGKLLRSEEEVARLKAEGASSKESLAATIAEMQEQLKTALGQRKQLEADLGSAKQSTAGLPKLVKELEQTKASLERAQSESAELGTQLKAAQADTKRAHAHLQELGAALDLDVAYLLEPASGAEAGASPKQGKAATKKGGRGGGQGAGGAGAALADAKRLRSDYEALQGEMTRVRAALGLGGDGAAAVKAAERVAQLATSQQQAEKKLRKLEELLPAGPAGADPVAALRTKLDKLEASRDAAATATAAAEERLASLQREQEAAATKVEQLGADHQKAEARCRELEAERDAARRDCDAAVARGEAAAAAAVEAASKGGALETEQREALARVETLEAANVTLEAANVALAAKAEALQSEAEAAAASRDGVAEEHRGLQDKCSSLEAKLAELAEAADGLEAKCAELQAASDATAAQGSDAAARVEEIAAERDTLAAKCTQAEEHRQQAEAELQELQGRHAVLEIERKALFASCNEAQTALHEVQTTLGLAASTASDADGAHSDGAASAPAALFKERLQALQTVQDNQTKIEAALDEMMQAVGGEGSSVPQGDLVERVKAVNRLVTEKETANEGLRSRISELEQKTLELTSEVEFLTEEMSTMVKPVALPAKEKATKSEAESTFKGLFTGLASNPKEGLELIKAYEVPKKHAAFTPAAPPRELNPLAMMADFEIDLLVNNEVVGQMQLEPGNLGIFQAAINYFHINGGTGQAYFDPEPPAVSQSSNIMLDLVFSPMDGEMSAYVATKGDAIGLAIRVVQMTNEGGTLTQQPRREILRNADVIRATEVVEAAPPGAATKLSNMSIWPDLSCSFRWGNSPEGWRLSRVRWRFLMKKVFPDIADTITKMVPRNMPPDGRPEPAEEVD